VAPSVMTDEERADIIVRLIAMQNVLRTVCEGAEQAGQLAKEADADGLAMATFLMKESIEQYARELNRFVLGVAADE